MSISAYLFKYIDINPKELLAKGALAKKISMDKLQPFCRDVPEYEIAKFSGGTRFRNGDTIMARITPCLENGKTAMVNILEPGEVGFGSTEFIVFRAKEGYTDPNFVYYLVKSSFVRDPAIKSMVGSSGRQRVQTDVVQNLIVPFPSLLAQRKIASILKSLDDKIALNTAINDNLEAAMRALFEHFVVSNEAYDFDEAIDDKIDFINGLAMQNYRPEKDETPIPVIKIRELSQGYCDENSEFCSNHIDKSHIIQNGDLVFSWSGSLQASFWTSQTAGLNQHLFKVQSDEYPLWFVYEWVTFHLLNFQRIAENKGTTFGHIKREDLHNAKIKSVGIDEINKLNNLFQPLLNTIIANSTELHSLMNYQRVLLARLSR